MRVTLRETLRRLEEGGRDPIRGMKPGYYVATVTGGNVRGEDDDTGRLVVLGSGDADFRELSRLATEKARDDFDDDDKLLAGYMHGRDLSADRIYRIDSPNIRIGNDGKVTTTFQVTAAADLSAAERKALASYIEGQCSDGWGEGFEQQEIELRSDGYVDRYYVSPWSTRANTTVTDR